MRIAILGWGSLVWDPGHLSRQLAHGDQGDLAWHPDGPLLPLEFSRVSADGCLTLVLDDRGQLVATRWAESLRKTLEEATEDVRAREGVSASAVGWVELAGARRRQARRSDIAASVAEWATRLGFEAAVWTDLPPSFSAAADREALAHAVLGYLGALSEPDALRAYEYFRRATPEIVTPVRRLVLRE